jgi:hypothetical protein
VIATATFIFTPMGAIDKAWACNMGTPGGGDFGPQARYRPAPSPSGNEVTQNQAYDILSGHLARLNPNLEIGKGVDAGSHFEFDVRVDGKRVDRLAVDKKTGLIRPVN